MGVNILPHQKYKTKKIKGDNMKKDELKKMFKELNEKYGFEWVGDNSLQLDYKPLNDDIEFKRVDDFNNEYEYQAYLEKEFEIVKPRIEKYFEELNQRLGMKIFTYEIDEYCDNRICFKLNE